MKTAAIASGSGIPSVGDPSTLVVQLGLPAGPDEASGSGVERVAWNDLAGFRDALVCGLEWPAIVRAAELARLGHHRELLELDRAFGSGLPAHLAKASCCVGRRQLARLRSLRDQRTIQRYLDAIEAGEAKGWNPVVYGVVLAQLVIGAAFAIRTMRGTFDHLSPRPEAVAMTLGCSRARAVWLVTLPAAKRGVTKVNIDTDGRLVWTRVHREYFRDKPGDFDFRPPGKIFIEEYAKFIASRNVLLGSAGQLESLRASLGK